jgi:hypothetical protein
MVNCNPVAVSMEPRLKLSKMSNQEPADATFYQSMVGTPPHHRHDARHRVRRGLCQPVMELPMKEYLVAVKHLLWYIAGTHNHGCLYTSAGNICLAGFNGSNVSVALISPVMLMTARAPGVLFTLGGCPVTWKSQKQKVVALSLL